MDPNLLISQSSKVASIIKNKTWHWDRSRKPVVREILTHIPPNLQPNSATEDSILWTLTATGKFSTKTALHGFRNPSPEVFWYNLVWFQQAAPRWSIIEWLAIRAQLSTKDRMQVLKITNNADCVLCSGVWRITPISSFHALFLAKSGVIFSD